MVGLVLVGKLHGGGRVVQRSEQILFHVTDRAAVLCKALQHKVDIISIFVAICNLVVDILYGIIDPRTR